MAKKKPVQQSLENQESNFFEFDLTETITIPVRIKDKDGVVREYELREATGDIACRWRNAIFARTELGPNGKPKSLGNIADTEPILVSLCLFDTKTNNNVSVQTVRSWPSKIQKSLFEKIKEISDLEDDEVTNDDVKNEQTDTTDGS